MRIVLSILLFVAAAGQRLQAAPQPPQEPGTTQPGEDPKVKELVGKALQLEQDAAKWQPTDQVPELQRRRDKLQQQIDLYLQILAISSTHPLAIANKANAEHDLAAIEERLRGIQTSKAEGEKGLSDAWASMQRLDFAAASTALVIAQRGLGSDPRVAVAERNLDRLRMGRNVFRYSAAALLALALGALFKILRGRRGGKFASVSILQGPMAGKVFSAVQETIRVGSVPAEGERRNDLVLEDGRGRVSRSHCTIQKKGERWFLIDDDSTNGTWVNKTLAAPQHLVPLRSGAVIDLAHCCILRFNLSTRQGV